VRNADFAGALGRVLHRPAFLSQPAFALRLALGREQADAVLLASQRATPRALLAAGFAFQHPTPEAALRHELGR
jgi:NAD dependent epimerase/dehydratase family enzyme